MPSSVLVVDDDQAMCETLEAGLNRRGFSVTWSLNGQSGLERLDNGEFDAVVTDINMKAMSGLEMCERIVARHPDVPVIIMTAFGSLEVAVAAIRKGAYDFVTKPLEMETLEIALRRAVEHKALRGEVKRLRRVAESAQGFGEVLGESAPMQRLFELLSRLRNSDASVLITGESGTGKEVLARALHREGARSNGPFVAINCAAMPEALLESELFGHVRGAFTDAKSNRAGLFVHSSGGTLFLDEIGELPLGLQSKLLRAIQERAVRPVGASTEVPFDARIVSATNRDLELAVEEKTFREDLYFRINVVRVEAPPLRSRGHDILLLAQHFLKGFAARAHKDVSGLSETVAERLLSYPWPGNVRELQNCMERAIALTRYSQVTLDDLPDRIRDYRSSHVVVASDDPAELVPLAEVERRYIQRVLDAVGGHRTTAARVLGIDRKTLYRKLGSVEPAHGRHD